MANVLQINQANPLTLVQQRFSLIKLSSDILILDNQEISSVLAGIKSDISFYKKPDGQLLIERHLETLPFPTKPKEVYKQFMVSPNTHFYDSTAFSPRPTPSTTLNFWVGHTVTPVAGDWSVIRDFIFDVICDGDSGLFDYLIKYIAHMLQRPEEKPGIAIVMLSQEGCGKGSMFALLNAIWTRTTLEVSDVDHVVGTFNGVLERNYIVCLDEALFRGNKAGMEKLKSLITEPNIHIEQKYQPARSIQSFHRFWAASNSDHFAQISQNERRLLFLRVSNKKKQDFAYFDTYYKAVSDPQVISALVHELSSMDISTFNVRQRPSTKEHLNQRLQSLTGFERFWFEVLVNGGYSFKDDGAYSSTRFTSWTDSLFISTNTLQLVFQQYDKNAGKYGAIQTREIANVLSKICPSASQCRPTINGKQERGYQLPKLNIARKEYEMLIGNKLNWGPGNDLDEDASHAEDFKAEELLAELSLEQMYEQLDAEGLDLPDWPD
jgi:Family of unknown function (DUF5906)